ncbi:MAG: hypothetical protein PUC90_02880 [Prevotella sp.]|nr:hypothetical protein [Prevotella sp.]
MLSLRSDVKSSNGRKGSLDMIRGEIKNILFGGLSSSPDSINSADGELQVCHNSINNGSSLVGLRDTKKELLLPFGWKGIVFVHHTTTGDNYIIVDDSGNAWWWRYDDAQLKDGELTKDAAGLTKIDSVLGGKFVDDGYAFTSIGNVLVCNIIGGDEYVGLNYFRFDSEGEGGANNYRYIGMQPPMPKLDFFLMHYSGTRSAEGNITYDDGYLIQKEDPGVQDWLRFRTNTSFSSILCYEEAFSEFADMTNHLMGNINKLKGVARQHGLFTGRFFVRVAYRLYDGTYTCHSAPLMITPSRENNPMVVPYYIKPMGRHESNGTPYWLVYCYYKVIVKFFKLCVRNLMTDDDRQSLQDWKDIVDRVCVFVTPEIQEWKSDPKNIQLTRREKLPFSANGGELLNDETNIKIENDATYDLTTIKNTFGKAEAKDWQDGAYSPGYVVGSPTATFQSVVSRRHPMPMGSFEFSPGEISFVPAADVGKNDNCNSWGSNKLVNTKQEIGAGNVNPFLTWKVSSNICGAPFIDSSEFIAQAEKDYFTIDNYKRMLAEFACYYHTIDIERKDEDIKELCEKQYQYYEIANYSIEELLNIGNDDDTAAEYPNLELNVSSSVYPQQGEKIYAPLHCSFVPIKGDALDLLTSSAETLTDDYSSAQRLQSRVMHVYNSRLHIADVDISFRPFPYTWLSCGQSSEIIDDITNREWQEIVSARVVIESDGNYAEARSESGICDMNVNMGWFYYPHSDAKRLELVLLKKATDIDGEKSTYLYINIPLERHPYMSGAYFFDFKFSLDNSRYVTAYGTKDEALARLQKVEDRIRYPNRLYTSEVDNPFVFPAEGVVTVGSQKIVAVSNANVAMSEGTSFGAHPLYVFCSDGVYPLSVGNTGLYVAVNAPTRESILYNDSHGVLQLESSVVYLSERGLVELRGSSTRLLSAALQGRYCVPCVNDLPNIDAIIAEVSQTERIDGICSHLEASEFMRFIHHNDVRLAYNYRDGRIVVYRVYKGNESVQGSATMLDGSGVAYVYDTVSGKWATQDSRLLSCCEGNAGSIVNEYMDNGVCISSWHYDYDVVVGNGKSIIITRPIKVTTADVFKTVYNVVLRDYGLKSNVIALYGSRDMQQWLYVSSSMHGRIPRIGGSAYRYYVAVVLVQHTERSFVSRLLIDAKTRYADRLR